MHTVEVGANGSSGAAGELKRLLSGRDPLFWPRLAERSEAAASLSELLSLSTLRKRALKAGFERPEITRPPLKIALIGAGTMYPLSELIEHFLFVEGTAAAVFTGDYNNYVSEVIDPASALYEFGPDVVMVVPDPKSCVYSGKLTDSRERVAEEAEQISREVLQLCATVHERSGAEVILCNYILPPFTDLGPFRSKSPAADWNFKKAVNFELGTAAPNYVHICDLEFLAYRHGGLASVDERSWFESKQLCSPGLLADWAKEAAYLINSLKQAPKKVLVLDLDNTLWGGVVGDDGIEGIEIGDTSPRGEAFKAFQAYILSLLERGVLLGVCSKNDHENAIEPFVRHPEMVLREEHFVSFKANWEPKAKNIAEMASELDLGLDSFIFVDDNPSEIEIVRQFAPEVTTILLGPDPSEYVRQLKESRLFGRFTITTEDNLRTEQYQVEAGRKRLQASAVDMDSYLASLDMAGTVTEFNSLDLPRIAQLVNKSNQFNLTTRRRTEGELRAMMSDPEFSGFSMRLRDRFGDHGLISVVICRQDADVLEVDTWLMSCRVLKRQVEEQILNEIVRLADERGCTRVRGTYIPTAKNNMVSDLYPRLGFEAAGQDGGATVYELAVAGFAPLPTFIHIDPRTNSDDFHGIRSFSAAAEYI